MMSCGEPGRPPISEFLAHNSAILEHPRGTEQPSCSAQTIILPILELHDSRRGVNEAHTMISLARVEAGMHCMIDVRVRGHDALKP